MRSLDNITVVIVAFDGFAKLFEPKSYDNSGILSHTSGLDRSSPQLRSTDDVRKMSAKQRERIPKAIKRSFDARETSQDIDKPHFSAIPKQKPISDTISTTICRNDSDRNSEQSAMFKN